MSKARTTSTPREARDLYVIEQPRNEIFALGPYTKPELIELIQDGAIADATFVTNPDDLGPGTCLVIRGTVVMPTVTRGETKVTL